MSIDLNGLQDEPAGGTAVVALFDNPDEIGETCEVCFARLAIGTFNVEDTETLLCRRCSCYRNSDNSGVVIVNECI